MNTKAGRKALHGEKMEAFHFRMTKAQREKLKTLGGAAWIRDQIGKAPGEWQAIAFVRKQTPME